MSHINEVLSVNTEVLKAIVLKRAHFTVLQGDWTMRKHEYGIGFEENERMRLEQAVEDAKNALYYKLLELETAEHYIAKPPLDFLEGGKYLKNGPTAERHERRGAKRSKLTTAVAAESSSSGRNDSSNKNE